MYFLRRVSVAKGRGGFFCEVVFRVVPWPADGSVWGESGCDVARVVVAVLFGPVRAVVFLFLARWAAVGRLFFSVRGRVFSVP